MKRHGRELDEPSTIHAVTSVGPVVTDSMSDPEYGSSDSGDDIPRMGHRSNGVEPMEPRCRGAASPIGMGIGCRMRTD